MLSKFKASFAQPHSFLETEAFLGNGASGSIPESTVDFKDKSSSPETAPLSTAVRETNSKKPRVWLIFLLPTSLGENRSSLWRLQMWIWRTHTEIGTSVRDQDISTFNPDPGHTWERGGLTSYLSLGGKSSFGFAQNAKLHFSCVSERSQAPFPQMKSCSECRSWRQRSAQTRG